MTYERKPMAKRRSWPPMIQEARNIVNSYNPGGTGYLITLRQLHYRLYMSPLGLGYHNNEDDYKYLSKLTAEGRREGTFPDLLDETREVHQADSWDDPADAVNWMAGYYRRDRTEGQPYYIALAGEKATLLAQLNAWFFDRGLPVILTRGYGSQTYVDEVRRKVQREAGGRTTILIYAGDLDPSGMDILRDFQARCPVWDKVEHIAVKIEQVERKRGHIREFLGLAKITPADDYAKFFFTGNHPKAGEYRDSRAPSFIARYGELFQTEVEAIEPDTLRRLYTEALDQVWDESAYEASLAQEEADKAHLHEIADGMEDDDDDE